MKKRIVLYTLLFSYGFSALIVQTLLLREYIVQFLGSELSVALVFFAWFLGIAVGATAFNFFDRINISNFTTLIFAFIFLFLGLFLSSFARIILKLPVGELVPTVKMIVAALIFVFPSGVGVGMSFPAIANIISNNEIFEKSLSLWSAIFGVEALGSLCAGMLFTFVLVQRLDPLAIAFLTMIFIFFALGLFACEVKLKKLGAPLFLVFALLIAAFILWGKSAFNILRSYLYERIYPAQEVVARVETPYKRLELVKNLGQFNLFADGQILTSFPDERRHALYSHLLLCLHPNPKRVLFLGGGIEGVVQHALLHPVKRLDVVMLDRREFELMGDYLSRAGLGLPDDDRFKLEIDDYVLYVKEALKNRTKYDLAIVFGSSPSNASSNRSYTVEFLKILYSALSEDGVVVLPILGGENYAGALISLTVASITKTLLIAGFAEVSLIPKETLLIVASKKAGVMPSSDEELINRYKNRGVNDPDFLPEALFGTMPKERIATIIRQVEPFMAVAKENSDSHPIAYLFQLLLLDKISGGSLSKFFGFSNILVKPALLNDGFKLKFKQADIVHKKMKKSYLPFAIGFVLAAGVFILFYKKADKLNKGAVLYGIFTTGLCGMSFEILTLYLYQARFGILYQNVSLLVASYMFGLTIGAFVFKIINVAKFKIFLLLEGVIVLTLLSPIGWRYFQSSSPWFFAMLAIFGVLGGFQLALGGALLQERYGVSGSASRIEAIDHLGAMTGSLTTGVFLVPILGIFYAIFILAFLKLTSALAIFAVSSRYRG